MANIDSAIPSKSFSDSQHSILTVYMLYRIGIAIIFWVLFFTDTGIGSDRPLFFKGATLIYSAINILVLFFISVKKWKPNTFYLLLIIASDLFFIQYISEISGDFASDFSAIIVVSVAAGTIFLSKKYFLLVPAFSSILLLIFSIKNIIYDNSGLSSIVSTGWLGIILFTASAFINYLSQRVKASEAEISEKTEHAEYLQALNLEIIQRMQTGILITIKNGQIITMNNSAKNLLNINAGENTYSLEDISSEAMNQHQIIFSEKNKDAIKKTSLDIEHEGKKIRLTWSKLSENIHSEALIFLEDLSKIAQEAQQLKLSSLGKLAASIAHEIRNPIGAASHAAQLLQETATTEEDKKLSQIIVDQAKRCSNIINDVMNISRGNPANIKTFELNTWLKEFIRDYQSLNKSSIHLISESNVKVKFDTNHLQQILTNLLDNAIRYSHMQIKTNEAYIYLHTDGDNKVILDIIDPGKGVEKNLIPQLFEPFMTTEQQGTGLGLYMCRELCIANQASIYYIESNTLHSEINNLEIENELANKLLSSSHSFRIQFPHISRSTISEKSD